RILDGVFRSVNCRPTPAIETNSVLTLCSHVRFGQWSSVMPHPFLYLFGVPKGMRAIPLVRPEPVHEIGLVIADREPPPPLARALREAAGGEDIQARLDTALPPPPGRRRR